MKGYKLKGFGRNHVIPKETDKPKAIIVTFPVQFLIDLAKSYNPELVKKKAQILWGYAECLDQIKFVNSDPEDYWSHIMGNVPVKEVRDNISHCYINILSKIRYRAKVICFECGKKGELITKQFGDGRKMSGKNWILLHQFEELKPAIPMVASRDSDIGRKITNVFTKYHRVFDAVFTGST